MGIRNMHYFRSFHVRDNKDVVLGSTGQASIVETDTLGLDLDDPISDPGDVDGDTLDPAPDLLSSLPAVQPSQVNPAPVATPEPSDQDSSQSMVTSLLLTTQFPLSTSETSAMTSSSSLAILSSSSATPATTSPPTSLPVGIPSTSSSTRTSGLAASIPTGAQRLQNTTEHTPPFYVGIVLGTIAGIACIAALIAWFIRIRSHTRQRKLIEEEMTGHDGIGINHSSSDIEADPGPPRDETSEYVLPESLVQKSTTASFAGSNLLLEQGDGTIPRGNDERNVRTSLSAPVMQGPYPLMRPSPAKIVSGLSVQESTHTLGPLQIANMTPGGLSTAGDESGRTPRPDLRSIHEEDPTCAETGELRREVPWSRIQSRSHSLRTGRVLDNRSNGNWQRMGVPDGEDNRDEAEKKRADLELEGWTATLKANLWTVFGVTGKNSIPEEEDHYTPKPHRTSIRDGNRQHPRRSVARGHSTSSSVSKLYTLEETGEGVGRVHIRGLDVYHTDYISPMPSRTTLGLDNDSLYPDIRNVTTRESQAPLLPRGAPSVSTGPRQRLVRRFDDRPAVSSQGSMCSIYSAESAATDACSQKNNGSGLQSSFQASAPSRAEREPTKRKSKTRRRERVARPKFVERTSSSSSTIMSFGSDLMRPGLSRNLSSREEFAKKALEERRRRVASSAKPAARSQEYSVPSWTPNHATLYE